MRLDGASPLTRKEGGRLDGGSAIQRHSIVTCSLGRTWQQILFGGSFAKMAQLDSMHKASQSCSKEGVQYDTYPCKKQGDGLGEYGASQGMSASIFPTVPLRKTAVHFEGAGTPSS